MPVYAFECRACGKTFDHFLHLAECTNRRKFPACPGGCGKRAVHRDLIGGVPNVQGDFKPFFSEQMACLDPSEHVPGETYDHDDRPLIKSRAHQRRLMKRLNFREVKSYTS